jgi:hypothetical protein
VKLRRLIGAILPTQGPVVPVDDFNCLPSCNEAFPTCDQIGLLSRCQLTDEVSSCLQRCFPPSGSGSVGWMVSQMERESPLGLLTGRVDWRASSMLSMGKVKLRSDCRDVAKPYDKV